MDMLYVVVVALIFLFGLTALRGAPYVPTHKRAVETALDMLKLQPSDVVVDLGSGDGVFLRAAAARGLRAYGYEINPLLCLVAWLRCRRQRQLVTVLWRDFWLSELPPETKAVFVFLNGAFMKRLERKLRAAATQRSSDIFVASYGFRLPGCAPLRTDYGVTLCKISPTSETQT